ncbi:MAG: hypothetical protein EBU15_13940 [Betaproteobacteria bacterium]|nr:hypothetical protein [Betaproteobacteria bacterium]
MLGDKRQLRPFRLRGEPALSHRYLAKLRHLDATHEPQTGDLAVMVTRSQADKNVSVFVHLDPSSPHRQLQSKSLEVNE